MSTKTKKKKAEPAPEHLYDVIRIGGRKKGDLEQNEVVVTSGTNSIKIMRGTIVPVFRTHVHVLRDAKHPNWVEEEVKVPGGVQSRMVQRGFSARYPFELLFSDIPKEVFKELNTICRDPDADELTEAKVRRILGDYEASLDKPMAESG